MTQACHYLLAPVRSDYVLWDCSQGTRMASCNVLIMNVLHSRPRVCCHKIARCFQNALSAHVCKWFQKYPVGNLSWRGGQFWQGKWPHFFEIRSLGR